MIQYKMPIHLEGEHFHENGTIRAGALLLFFQQVAEKHADLLGVGYEDMMKDGRIWVITRLRCRVLEEMNIDGSYYIVTYPRPKKSRICPRDYYIYDDEGKLMVIGSGLWSVMDYKTRKLERIPFEYEGELYEKDAFEEGFERLQMNAPEEVGVHTVVSEDLDQNDHTNNCRYADLACDAAQMGVLRELSIQFAKETRLGDEIRLYKEEHQGAVIISGELCGASPQQVFLAKITGASE